MPLFAVWATDRDGALPERVRVRQAHRARLRASEPHAVKVVLAGPLSNEAGMNGTMLVVQAGDIDAVRAFVDGDPYVEAGVYERVDIRPWTCGLGPLKDL